VNISTEEEDRKYGAGLCEIGMTKPNMKTVVLHGLGYFLLGERRIRTKVIKMSVV